MGKIVYKTTERGDVVKVSNNKLFKVQKVEVSLGRRGQIVTLTLEHGKPKRILRWQVDEAMHSFGPQVTEMPAKGTGKARTAKTVIPKKSVRKIGKRAAVRRRMLKAIRVPAPVIPWMHFAISGNQLYVTRRVTLSPEQLEAIQAPVPAP